MLQRGSIDNPLTFEHWSATTHFSYYCDHLIHMNAKVFSIQIFQYFHQISLRVCTLVIFITTSLRVHFSHAVKSYCMQYPWNILLFYPLPHPIYLSVSSQQSQLLLACTISPSHTLHYSPSFCTQLLLNSTLLLNSACQFSKHTATQLTHTHTHSPHSRRHTATQLHSSHIRTLTHSHTHHTLIPSNHPALGELSRLPN